MFSTAKGISSALAGATALLLAFATPAEVIQTLDSVDAMTSKAVLEMRVGGIPADDCDPDSYACVTVSLPSQPPLISGIPASATFAACQRSADRNLYCLLNSFTSGSSIRQPVTRWSETGNYEALFDCTDPKLGLDVKKANPCTSITADLGGDIWLGGRDGTAYSIIRVVEVPQGSDCPAGFGGKPMTRLGADLSDTHDYCMLRYVSGRPVIVDMSAIDAKVGKGFEAPNVTPGPGILLLEDRKTVVFLADQTDDSGNPKQVAAVEIASGKTDFALVGNETLQSTSLMQLNCTGSLCDNYLLVTTSTGRVMAKRTDPIGAAFPVYVNSACATGVTQQSWVRVSPQSGRVYVSDRCANMVRGFAVPAAFPVSSQLELKEELATVPASSTTNTLNTLSVSPGIPIDLSKCTETEPCILYPDQPVDSNLIGAQISNVHVELLTGKTGMTVFRITGIPDCRYITPLPDICNTPGAVTSVNGVPGYLDVAKLLPLEVTKLFDQYTDPTLAGLELLIGPQFRARPDRGNTFDAFFGRTEDGVQFRETFDIEFDIRELMNDPAGTPTRCGYLNSDLSQRSPDNWDIITTVSERVPVAGINNGTGFSPGGELRHRDMLVNTFCQNPSSGSGTRWSLYGYGLMLSSCVVGASIDNSVLACRKAFVTLTDQLFDDLERARKLTACANVDGNPVTADNGGAPLSTSTCSTLAADWLNSRDKLTKCLDATVQPKNSSLNQNCQAFDSQFQQYQDHLAAATVNGNVVNGLQTGDRANRLGELRSRVAVFLHIYRDQMLPSVPPGGFLQ